MTIITTNITENGKRKEIEAIWRGYRAPKIHQSIFICDTSTHKIHQSTIKDIIEDIDSDSIYEAYIAEEPEKGRDRGKIVDKKTTETKSKKRRELNH